MSERQSFMHGIAPGRREGLARALKALWTHDSTAIEGNTLTLGETMFVLQYGLTVKGKPLKDHDDIVSHARGVDLIQRLTAKGAISAEDIFELHRTVVTSDVADIYKTIGAWKREENGTYNAVGGRPVYMAYADVDETPQLMGMWLKDFNASLSGTLDPEAAIDAYVRAHVGFVRIHPFFDGNGRLARLLANLPVLRSGHPPIVVPVEDRGDYINALWDYSRAVGTATLAQGELLPQSELLAGFRALVKTWWQTTLDLVAEAKAAKAAKTASDLCLLSSDLGGKTEDRGRGLKARGD